MYRTILVPLDGSPLAERALPYASVLARGSGAHLALVRVPHEEPRTDAPESTTLAWATGTEPLIERTTGRGGAAAPEDEGAAPRGPADYLEDVAAGLALPQTAVAVVSGPPAAGILGEARDRTADLIVMATHGRSGLGRWLYGSVADDVLRHADRPVLLVPATAPPTPLAPPDAGSRRVLVALDGSPFAEAALGPAQDLAQALGAGLVLLRVVEPPGAAFGGARGEAPSDPAGELADARAYLDTVAGRLPAPPESGPGAAPVGQAHAGAPAQTITAVAGKEAVSAIAMATHGRSGLARAVLGSVATEVLHRTAVPVLLVRPRPAPAGETAPAGDRGGTGQAPPGRPRPH
jgi:nucleotide-binding universal stress UspA family protein